MDAHDQQEITRLLDQLREGDTRAEEQLVAAVYDELRLTAGRIMKGERASHTLQPTALVHEAFLRLRPQLTIAANRRYLFAAARKAMRRVLIDHARTHRARKRTPPPQAVTEPATQRLFDRWPIELVDVLDELARLAPRQHQIVEYRFLVGLTVDQTAEQLGLSRSQIERDWRMARAWLFQRIGGTQ
jgi:RNA polymerase sigma factor (TIGR02999 family)